MYILKVITYTGDIVPHMTLTIHWLNLKNLLISDSEYRILLSTCVYFYFCHPTPIIAHPLLELLKALDTLLGKNDS
jgi:hypothetical protein